MGIIKRTSCWFLVLGFRRERQPNGSAVLRFCGSAVPQFCLLYLPSERTGVGVAGTGMGVGVGGGGS